MEETMNTNDRNSPSQPQRLTGFNKVLIAFAVFVLGAYAISANWHDVLYHTKGVVLLITGLWYLLAKIFLEHVFLDIFILTPCLHYFILKGKGVAVNATILCCQIIVLLLVINVNFHRFVDDFTVKPGNSALYPLASKDWGIIDTPVASFSNFLKYMQGVSSQAYSGWKAGDYQQLTTGGYFHSIYHYQPGFIFKFYICMMLLLVHVVFFVVKRVGRNKVGWVNKN